MKIDKELQQRIDRAVKEEIEVVPYNPQWPLLFEKEAEFLKKNFSSVIGKIEHFGSTSVPGLAAKPIVDMLVEISTYKEAKRKIVPKLTSLGYEYFWRPEFDKPPMYVWFIKRNDKGERTHHIHMVRKDSKLWDRIYFRDYLKTHPEIAKQYEKLKTELAKKYSKDRVKYTKDKTEFITKITKKAKEEHSK